MARDGMTFTLRDLALSEPRTGLTLCDIRQKKVQRIAKALARLVVRFKTIPVRHSPWGFVWGKWNFNYSEIWTMKARNKSRREKSWTVYVCVRFRQMTNEVSAEIEIQELSNPISRHFYRVCRNISPMIFLPFQASLKNCFQTNYG